MKDKYSKNIKGVKYNSVKSIDSKYQSNKSKLTSTMSEPKYSAIKFKNKSVTSIDIIPKSYPKYKKLKFSVLNSKSMINERIIRKTDKTSNDFNDEDNKIKQFHMKLDNILKRLQSSLIKSTINRDNQVNEEFVNINIKGYNASKQNLNKDEKIDSNLNTLRQTQKGKKNNSISHNPLLKDKVGKKYKCIHNILHTKLKKIGGNILQAKPKFSIINPNTEKSNYDSNLSDQSSLITNTNELTKSRNTPDQIGKLDTYQFSSKLKLLLQNYLLNPDYYQDGILYTMNNEKEDKSKEELYPKDENPKNFSFDTINQEQIPLEIPHHMTHETKPSKNKSSMDCTSLPDVYNEQKPDLQDPLANFNCLTLNDMQEIEISLGKINFKESNEKIIFNLSKLSSNSQLNKSSESVLKLNPNQSVIRDYISAYYSTMKQYPSTRSDFYKYGKVIIY